MTLLSMDCIFCKNKHTVTVERRIPKRVTYTLYRAECCYCGARGQSHDVPEQARQEWKNLLRLLEEQDADAAA